jgi:hypothetical protein
MRKNKPTLTRTGFEKLCGGVFRPFGDEAVRYNGVVHTYLAWSDEPRRRVFRVCEIGGNQYSGRTWYDVARAIGLFDNENVSEERQSAE